MIRAMFLAGLISGCAEAPPPPVPIPARLQVCPDPRSMPAPPPAPRTVAQVIEWTGRLVGWGNANAAALAECRRRLDERNSIGQNS